MEKVYYYVLSMLCLSLKKVTRNFSNPLEVLLFNAEQNFLVQAKNLKSLLSTDKH